MRTGGRRAKGHAPHVSKRAEPELLDAISVYFHHDTPGLHQASSEQKRRLFGVDPECVTELAGAGSILPNDTMIPKAKASSGLFFLGALDGSKGRCRGVSTSFAGDGRRVAPVSQPARQKAWGHRLHGGNGRVFIADAGAPATQPARSAGQRSSRRRWQRTQSLRILSRFPEPSALACLPPLEVIALRRICRLSGIPSHPSKWLSGARQFADVGALDTSHSDGHARRGRPSCDGSTRVESISMQFLHMRLVLPEFAGDYRFASEPSGLLWILQSTASAANRIAQTDTFRGRPRSLAGLLHAPQLPQWGIECRSALKSCAANLRRQPVLDNTHRSGATRERPDNSLRRSEGDIWQCHRAIRLPT
ncbi:hypothetical protein LMG27177_07335 [Paraburkholderia fynbosensis]|uniref:Uncharacterized protein n=1 Tax=Paraburkholderia fynbosensis TaxID=1200993 RepID=A0A6J5H144_9BURK|nr:hypothetical protein LMG27177_07335 [Paraburkholderia fynbosensis]